MMTAPKTVHSKRLAFWLVLAMLAMIAAPVGVTLGRIRLNAFQPLSELLPENPSPYGYTVSLLIFLVPIVLIGFWFLPNEKIRVSKSAFWITIAILFPMGGGLDFFFARSFFSFPNSGAVLGISAWAIGKPIPIEEYLFYFSGFLTVLLFYIWLDGYWLHLYSVPENDTRRTEFSRLIGFHPDSLVLAALLIAAAIGYRGLAHVRPPGFPGYFVFLVLSALLPSVVLFKTVERMINWRAFSLTLFIIVLVSLLWEATLAIPYGWWAYQPAEMVGIYALAWHCLPVEAIFVWITVTYATVIVYEAIRCWRASGRTLRRAFWGRTPSASARPAPKASN
jgi:hypothetical protein